MLHQHKAYLSYFAQLSSNVVISFMLVGYSPCYADEEQQNYRQLEEKIDQFFLKCKSEIPKKYQIYQPIESESLTNEWNSFLSSYNWTIEQNAALASFADIVISNSPKDFFEPFFSIPITYFYPHSFIERKIFSKKVEAGIEKRINKINGIESELGITIEELLRKNNIPQESEYYSFMAENRENLKMLKMMIPVMNQFQKNDLLAKEYLSYFKKTFFSKRRKAFNAQTDEPFIDKCGNLFLKESEDSIIYKREIFQHEAGHILLTANAFLKRINAIMDGNFFDKLQKMVSSEKDIENIKKTNNIKEIQSNLAQEMEKYYYDNNKKDNDELLIDAISIIKSKNNGLKYITMLADYLPRNSSRYKFSEKFYQLNKKINENNMQNTILSPYFSIVEDDFLKMSIIFSNGDVKKFIQNTDITSQALNNFIGVLEKDASQIEQSILSETSATGSRAYAEEKMDMSLFLFNSFGNNLTKEQVSERYSDTVKFKAHTRNLLNELSKIFINYQQNPYEGI